MSRWIVTTVTTKGNTFVSPFHDYEDAKEQYEMDKRSFNSSYCQIMDGIAGRITDQWVFPYFGANFETDA